jgi:Flp pilus assembly protein CpaB
MPSGFIRTVTRAVTVPANSVLAFSATPPLPFPHIIQSVTSDNPAVEVLVTTVNGVCGGLINPGDRVSVVFLNNTGASAVANITITAIELDSLPPR